MAKFFGSFFVVLLVLSVASMLPGSDALDGGCEKVMPTSGDCNPQECMSWCSQNYRGHAKCYDKGSSHACVCVYC
uniref:Uncharacterized protein n=1 Tax=Nelumbo nucifera TaxID=4432 RepID=A0A822ZKG7_NELNU|nr:TPA_asm: hypothetical protein HUJ06_003607 [Nelumbo nucifera]